jgi:DNA-directed RNA polymerase specialized sigma subunit
VAKHGPATWTDARIMEVLAGGAIAAPQKQAACAALVERYYEQMLGRAAAELPPHLQDLAEDVEGRRAARIDTAPAGCRPQPSACGVLDDREQTGSLLGHLSRSQQRMMRLFYLDGLRAGEIAARLRLTLGQVYRELHQARTVLREQALRGAARRPEAPEPGRPAELTRATP